MVENSERSDLRALSHIERDLRDFSSYPHVDRDNSGRLIFRGEGGRYITSSSSRFALDALDIAREDGSLTDSKYDQFSGILKRYLIRNYNLASAELVRQDSLLGKYGDLVGVFKN